MNILIYLSSPNLQGGTPVKALQIAQKSKHRHYIYFYSQSFIPEFYDADYAYFCKWAKCFQSSSFIFTQIRDLIKIIDRSDISIFHTYFFRGILVGAIIKFFRPRVKVLFSFESGIAFSGKTKNIIAKRCISFIDYYIYISKFVQKSQYKFYPALARKEGTVVFNGAERKNDGRTFSGIHKGKKIVLTCVAGFSRLKNQIVILQAIDIIVNKNHIKDIILNLVGAGDEYEVDKQYMIDHHLENNVIMNGFCNDVGSALSNADIILHPSYAEGFGIAVVEGMLAGLTPLLADKGALPELIEDGESGYLLPHDNPQAWANKIIELYNNPAKVKQIGEAARKRAEMMFSVKKFIENIDSIYDYLVPKE